MADINIIQMFSDRFIYAEATQIFLV